MATALDCCDGHYASGWGLHPFSITSTVRKGVRFYTAEWFPTRCRRNFATKREATACVKAHEAVAYARKAS